MQHIHTAHTYSTYIQHIQCMQHLWHLRSRIAKYQVGHIKHILRTQHTHTYSHGTCSNTGKAVHNIAYSTTRHIQQPEAWLLFFFLRAWQARLFFAPLGVMSTRKRRPFRPSNLRPPPSQRYSNGYQSHIIIPTYYYRINGINGTRANTSYVHTPYYCACTDIISKVSTVLERTSVEYFTCECNVNGII